MIVAGLSGRLNLLPRALQTDPPPPPHTFHVLQGTGVNPNQKNNDNLNIEIANRSYFPFQLLKTKTGFQN